MNYPSDSSYTELKRIIRKIVTEPYLDDRNKLGMIWEIVK